jgi:hypothetical protein
VDQVLDAMLQARHPGLGVLEHFFLVVWPVYYRQIPVLCEAEVAEDPTVALGLDRGLIASLVVWIYLLHRCYWV